MGGAHALFKTAPLERLSRGGGDFESTVGGLFHSQDGGESWKRVGIGHAVDSTLFAMSIDRCCGSWQGRELGGGPSSTVRLASLFEKKHRTAHVHNADGNVGLVAEQLLGADRHVTDFLKRNA